MSSELFWTYWYFHLPNYALALIGYLLLGRFLMGFFAKPNWRNYIWVSFCRLTDPALAAVALVTPRYVLPIFWPLFGAIWVYLLRFLLMIGLSVAGLGPQAGG